MYIAGTKTKDTVEDAYVKLAIGIVKQACVDYAREYKASLVKGEPTVGLTKLEKWFRSRWAITLTFGEGELILEQVRRNVESILENDEKGEDLDYGKW